MPIRRMQFSEESQRDIHLIRDDPQRNTSRIIRDMGLFFFEELPDGTESRTPISAREYLRRPATDVAIGFNPTFLHTAATDDATNFNNFGIHVNRAGGVVLVDKNPGPPPFPSNFLIEVTAQHTGAAASHPPIDPLVVRVHVHDGVDRMWITPRSSTTPTMGELTVRRQTPSADEETNYRFAVHARFTDGVVGDVTALHGVTWTPTANFDSRTATSPDGDFRAGFVHIPAGTTGASPPVTVTATWQAGGLTLTATASIRVADPWTPGPTLPRIEHVSGSPATWGGGNPADVANVLLLGAGYTTPSLNVFEDIVTTITEGLRTDPMTRPYDVLASSMNVWRVGVPAANAGLSVRDAVYLKDATTAAIVPRAVVRRPAGTDEWTVENLIYRVGLPLPSYLTQFNPAGDTFMETVNDFWKKTVLTPPSDDPTRVSQAIVMQWLTLANRFFIDEVDAFPPLSISDPPKATGGSYSLELHQERGGATQLQPFFGALEAAGSQRVPAGPGGTNLGLLWSQDRADFAFDNRDYIVVITAGIGGAIFRTGRGVFIPIVPKFLFKVAPVADGRLQHAPGAGPTPPTKSAFPEFNRMVAHELSHAFGLEDEYPGQSSSSFTAPEESLDRNPNVTSLVGVSVASSPPPAPREIRTKLVKWNWDRIRKAAVLTGPVTVSPGGFEIPVVAGHQLAFKPTDPVRLRRRRPRVPIAAVTLTTDAALNLTVVSVGASSITVTGTAGIGDFLSYDAGSLLYVPVIGTTGDASDPFLKMIAPLVAKQIDDSGRPLTPEPCDPAAVARLGSGDQIPLIDALAGAWPELLTRWSRRHTTVIVGLYSGGARVGCGIFHPTGACMMRNHYSEAAEFCAVCRYALVDLIDPTKHGEIDRYYERIYPD